jgi:hypothetical protein
MPAKAQPPVIPAAPKTHVHSAGKQEDFAAAGAELAAKLGWDGPANYVANEIAVADARGFLTKSLHEAHIAGATDALMSFEPIAEHLGITDDGERQLLLKALNGAYESGKGAKLTAHKIVARDLGGANLELDSNKVVG